MNITDIKILTETVNTTIFTITYKTWYGKEKTIEAIVSNLVTLKSEAYKTDGNTWYAGDVSAAVRVFADLDKLTSITKFRDFMKVYSL